MAPWRDTAERDHHGCDSEGQCGRSQRRRKSNPVELIVGVNRQREWVIGEESPAPYSPKARSQARNMPPRIPGAAKGRAKCRNRESSE